MQPTNPSRRRLLAGLFAGLFGWLSCGKNRSQAQAPPPVPAADCPSPVSEAVVCYTYDEAGNRISAELRPESSSWDTVYTFDAQTRLTRVTHP